MSLSHLQTTLAQLDSDHPRTDGVGRTFLSQDGLLPGVNPYNMTIGLNPTDFATLRVRGDELQVFDEFTPSWVCTFRTDATNFVDQNWSMHRGNIEIGRLFTHATGDENFHIQASSGDLRFWTREGSFSILLPTQLWIGPG